ncbi:nitrilase-related carbon-nitrogen hydrolase [Psychromonas sp. KJ10-10]|uniref:nitrilase-related carbon-nitrogen hydrolase n=1 Tax=Psychromonas sp. KJ10-10 TaxID=3391823 RepID=UPI0039B620B6
MSLKIAVAQIISKRGEVDENIRIHLQAIKCASRLNVSYLVFPELSLTGYEPNLGSQLAFSKDDERLAVLIDARYRI